jgi:hypothetical protein
MLTYNDIYESLRKEKYSEQLQPLPKNFITQFSEYLKEKRKQLVHEDQFSSDLLRERKQIENAVALFKELMLRRKKKILNLVFVAAETGILKKDFTDMLSFEQELFEELVKSVDSSDKKMNEMLNGKSGNNHGNKLILTQDNIEQFVDMNGNIIGPFKKGELVNIDDNVAEILVSGGKALHVDEKE